MKDLTYLPRHTDSSGWKERHLNAVYEGLSDNSKVTLERAMVLMIKGWCLYAEAMKQQLDWNIGDDQVLGDEWFKIGEALRGLLNGDMGRLDGGTLDTIIADNLNEQGFDPDLGKRKRD